MLERLHPALPPVAITAAVDDLTRDRWAIFDVLVKVAEKLDDSITGVDMPAFEG